MNENEFGYRVRQALNESAERLDYKTAYRLEQARRKALAAHRAETAPAWRPVLVPAGGPPLEEDARRAGASGSAWSPRCSRSSIGFVGIYQWQQERRITELADMDFAVLLDDAPIGTYADKGFGTLLQTGTDEL